MGLRSSWATRWVQGEHRIKVRPSCLNKIFLKGTRSDVEHRETLGPPAGAYGRFHMDSPWNYPLSSTGKTEHLRWEKH